MSAVTIGTGWGFNLGDAQYYALIAFNPHNFQGTANSPIYGNVGVGAYSGIQLANDTITGNLVTTGAVPSKTGGHVTGTVTGHNTTLAADITGLEALSKAAGLETGTVITLHNGQTIQANKGTWDSHGNQVFTVTNWADNITIHGSDTQNVIINVPAGVKFTLDNLHLTGGITPNTVLINYLGTDEVHGVNKDTFQGTVLAPNAKINVDGVNLLGHLFGGAPGQDFQWVSGANVHNTPPGWQPCMTSGAEHDPLQSDAANHASNDLYDHVNSLVQVLHGHDVLGIF
ncbi:MAG: collagen-binding domain-containing protein [Rhizomicrobium sp.]